METTKRGNMDECENNENLEIVEMLIKRQAWAEIINKYVKCNFRGANPELCDIDGLTPLMIGAEKGHKHVVNILVENGAKLDTQDKDDQTFFHICAEYNQSDIIKVNKL